MENKSLLNTNAIDVSSESRVRDYLALTKPGVLSLVVFSSITGMVLAKGEIHYFVAIVSIFAISLGSASAAAINMWYDLDIDSIMLRTRNRPLVRGVISPEHGLAFGIITGVFSVLIMSICVNYISALLLLTSILFYVFVYTIWLKRITPQNIVIGGAAGAIPPIIGWTSVTNSIDLPPLILFLIIFFWTPPHFWALALSKNEDYVRAKIPMMPITQGYYHTKVQMLFYSILTYISSLGLILFCQVGLLYIVSAFVLGGKFVFDTYKLLKDTNNRDSMKLFGFSIIYLFELFGVLIIDHYFTTYSIRTFV